MAAKNPFSFSVYCEARAIHAFLLRCEGFTYQLIGDRMTNMQSSGSINRDAARCLVGNASLRINSAMRRTQTKWHIVKGYAYDDGFDPLI